MLKSEISNLQVEKSILESRVSGLLSTRAGEKAALSSLEKKLADERKQKAEFQMKLETERKNKKEAASAERAMQQNQTRSEVVKLEAEIKTLRQELQMARDRCEAAEREVYILRQYKETHGDPELLVNALKVIDKLDSFFGVTGFIISLTSLEDPIYVRRPPVLFCSHVFFCFGLSLNLFLFIVRKRSGNLFQNGLVKFLKLFGLLYIFSFLSGTAREELSA